MDCHPTGAGATMGPVDRPAASEVPRAAIAAFRFAGPLLEWGPMVDPRTEVATSVARAAAGAGPARSGTTLPAGTTP
jgi:hypothetical protein